MAPEVLRNEPADEKYALRSFATRYSFCSLLSEAGLMSGKNNT